MHEEHVYFSIYHVVGIFFLRVFYFFRESQPNMLQSTRAIIVLSTRAIYEFVIVMVDLYCKQLTTDNKLTFLCFCFVRVISPGAQIH